MTKTCAREGCDKTFEDVPRRWTQPKLYCSPECRNAVGYAKEKAKKKAMAKEEIPEEEAPEAAPAARRSSKEVEQAVLATLGRKKKQLIDIIAESGVCRSSTAKVLKAHVETGTVTRHAGGFYSLAQLVAEPTPQESWEQADADYKARKAQAPEAPAEEGVTFESDELLILSRLAAPALRALLEKVERCQS